MSKCLQCELPERSQRLCDARDCPALVTGPTAERLQHGHVDSGAEVLVYDKEGRASRSIAPRAIDTVGRLLRNGSITAAMATSASRFRAEFRKAALQELRAADPSRVIAPWGAVGRWRAEISCRSSGTEPDRIHGAYRQGAADYADWRQI